jgi:hypothetical protein
MIRGEGAQEMYVIREVMNCKPGKVRQMVDRFRVLSAALRGIGHERLRLMTDVSGERFWTVVVEVNVEKIDDFFAIEQRLMSNEEVRQAMAGYHDLVESGRREVYRVENE